jgi:hypothetical protein
MGEPERGDVEEVLDALPAHVRRVLPRELLSLWVARIDSVPENLTVEVLHEGAFHGRTDELRDELRDELVGCFARERPSAWNSPDSDMGGRVYQLQVDADLLVVAPRADSLDARPFAVGFLTSHARCSWCDNAGAYMPVRTDWICFRCDIDRMA